MAPICCTAYCSVMLLFCVHCRSLLCRPVVREQFLQRDFGFLPRSELRVEIAGIECSESSPWSQSDMIVAAEKVLAAEATGTTAVSEPVPKLCA